MKDHATLLALPLLLLAACTGSDDDNAGDEATANAAAEEGAEAQQAGASGWDLQSSDEGVALILGPGADAAIRLFCPAGANSLLVNVPTYRPIGSEERLSFGSGGEVVALVADTRGDADRGGVSATGAVPEDLATLLSEPLSTSYGTQTSGPHQAPPPQLASAFAAACGDGSASSISNAVRMPGRAEEETSACLRQDGKPIAANRLKAIGTEPFWAAEIKGRCVTYSTPENQAGTRIWTSFTGTAERGRWSGYLADQRFTVRTRPEPGCSDGMSDKRYPLAVTLNVRGEQRRGCAEPL